MFTRRKRIKRLVLYTCMHTIPLPIYTINRRARVVLFLLTIYFLTSRVINLLVTAVYIPTVNLLTVNAS